VLRAVDEVENLTSASQKIWQKIILAHLQKQRPAT
jgi:hypothetical protein